MSRCLVIVNKSSNTKISNPDYNTQIIESSEKVEVCPYVEINIPNSYFSKIDFAKFNNRTCDAAIKLADRYIDKLRNSKDIIEGDVFVANNENLIDILMRIKSLSEKYINEKWKFE